MGKHPHLHLAQLLYPIMSIVFRKTPFFYEKEANNEHLFSTVILPLLL